MNHKLVPLSHKLQSGDQVEILTSKSQRVQPEWEAYATTARARAKIASILRKEAKVHQKEGETILADFFKNEDIRMDDKALDKLTRLHNFHTRDELLIAVGSKKLVLGDADRNAFKEKQSTNWKKFLTFSFGNKDSKDANKEASGEKAPQEKINTKQILKLTEETIQKNFIMADCCHPIPGDDVLGYIDEQNRVIIHKRQCPVAARLKSSYGNRIIATEWDTHKELSFLVTIYIKGIDSMGLLNEVTQVISRQLNVNIRKLAIETNDGIFEGKIQLYVHDADDVRSICDNLKQIQNIKQVTRSRNKTHNLFMKRCKITILKTTLNEELAKEYAAPGFTKCPMMREGQVFYADYAKPEGFCDEAWKAVYQYVFALSHGSGIFYYGDWITKEGVAICSCNDGLRPVIMKIERTDEEARISYEPIKD